MNTPNSGLAAGDLLELREAKRVLEHPGLAVKLSNLVGKPIEKGIDMLPAAWSGKINSATQDALHAALKLALRTMDKSAVAPVEGIMGTRDSSPWWHKAAAVTSGMLGGAFGLPAVLAELPVSTTIILRSIADIARRNGEDLNAPDGQLACMTVFALGGTAKGDDAAESGYFAARLGLARAVSEAATFISKKAFTDKAAPALLRLIAVIASRFQVVVTQKAAAQAIPGIGAVMGGTVNYLFIDHFQSVSHAHFAVRRLERTYGETVVRLAYEQL